MYYSVVISLAIIASQFYPRLWSSSALFSLLLAGLLLASLLYRLTKRGSIMLLLLVIAFSYGQFMAGQSLEQKMPKALEQQDLRLRFEVISLVVQKPRYQQFTAKVLSRDSPLAGKQVLLNLYSTASIQSCARYQAVVRLKRPHGLANPNAFDYEAYLLEQAISAKGYVRELGSETPASGFCLNAWRQGLKDHIVKNLEPASAAWLLALSIGDKTALAPAQQQLLRETATGHLFVISGLHIGLAAAAVFGLLLLLRRAGLGLLYYADWRPAAYGLAFLAAYGYALLAGFSLPTQRALLMLLVFFGGNVLGVSSRVWTRYFLALALLLVIKPQSVLNVGFVLSFMALFFILLLGGQQPKAVTWQAKLWLLLRWQCCLSLLLMPVLYFYFQQWAFIAALCNLIAIPVISLFIVPQILLALMLFLLGFQPDWLWSLPGHCIDYLMQAMAWLNQHLSFLYVDYPLSLQALVCVFLAAVCFCLQPKKLFRPLVLLLLFAAILLKPQATPTIKALYIDVIDVGQGLSVLLQTANHNIVYDLGANWQGGSMFGYAVLPLLRARQVQKVDYLIISHHDNDHLGDYRQFLQHYPMAKVISSEALVGVASDKFSLCAQGQSLHLDGVDFYLLNPVLPAAATRNDNSCVIDVHVAGRHVLLSGDISAKQERKILQVLPATIDVLIAPHHGSKYSSSQALVDKAATGRVIFSAGYLSRFNHPHPDVVQRFKAAGSQLHSTADEGLIHLEISAEGQIHSQAFRYTQPRYWRDATKL